MRIFSVPARYAPEIERAIAQAVRMIKYDAKLRDGRARPRSGGYIEPEMIDESLRGTLVIQVVALPAEAPERVFPIATDVITDDITEGAAA